MGKQGVFVSLTSVWNIAVSVVRKFAEAYKTISGFEQANVNLATILDVNFDQMEALSDSALKLGRQTAYTASEVTQIPPKHQRQYACNILPFS